VLAHHWLDELTRSPDQTIESLTAREGKTERWIRRTTSLALFSPPLSKRRSTVDCLAALGVKRLMDLRNANLLLSR
jgi:hypothetical protein